MKRTITLLLLIGFATTSFAQELGYGPVTAKQNLKTSTKSKVEGQICNIEVVNETDEQNGVFIIGNSGQKAAVDIPLIANQEIKINSINVTLSSRLVPSFVRLAFYNNIMSTPEDEDVQPSNIPNEIILKVDDTTIESYEEVGYEPMHQFVVRNIKLKLQNPIILNSTMSAGPIWMRVFSDANAWATNNTGNVIGESVAMGSDRSGWFQLLTVEGLYKINAECSFLDVSDTNKATKVTIAPNPAQNFIEYHNLNNMKVLTADIYDESGRIIKSAKAYGSKLYIGDLKKGVYFIKSKTSTNIILSDKIVKN